MKAKPTSLPNGFIENPIQCSHWATTTEIKEKIRFRSLQINLNGLFTPGESGSESEKDKMTSEKDQRTNIKTRQR